MNIDIPTPILHLVDYPKPLKISHKKFTLQLKILKKLIIERIEKYYEEIVKLIKDCTFSNVDKLGQLWDDRKKNGRKFDY